MRDITKMHNGKPFEESVYGKIYTELLKLEIGQFFDKREYVRKNWKCDDETGNEFETEYYAKRRFDVHLVYAKRLLPERKFKSIKNKIYRHE